MYNYVVAIKKKQVGEIIMLVKQKIIIYNMKNPQGEIQNRLRSGHYWDIYIYMYISRSCATQSMSLIGLQLSILEVGPRTLHPLLTLRG